MENENEEKVGEGLVPVNEYTEINFSNFKIKYAELYTQYRGHIRPIVWNLMRYLLLNKNSFHIKLPEGDEELSAEFIKIINIVKTFAASIPSDFIAITPKGDSVKNPEKATIVNLVIDVCNFYEKNISKIKKQTFNDVFVQTFLNLLLLKTITNEAHNLTLDDSGLEEGVQKILSRYNIDRNVFSFTRAMRD